MSISIPVDSDKSGVTKDARSGALPIFKHKLCRLTIWYRILRMER